MNVIHRINSINPYNVGGRFDLPDDWLHCDWNESLFPPTPKVQIEILKFLKKSTIQNYPDISNRALLASLSEYTGLPAQCIEAYSGSDDALRDIFTAFVDESKSVISYQPSYSQVDTFIETNTHRYDRHEIIDPLGEHIYDFSVCGSYDVVYLVNPNNPTGKLIPIEQIEELLCIFPDTLFVIDEAYYEYSDLSCVELVTKHNNILVTRTFSKAFGLAGLRLGYVLGSEQTLNGLRKIKNGKSVNSIAQIAGIACLSDLEYLQNCVKQTKESIQIFTSEVSSMDDYFCLDSHSNFVLLKVPNVERFKNLMESKRVIIRDRSYLTNLDGCVRINFGPLTYTKQIIEIMKGKV